MSKPPDLDNAAKEDMQTIKESYREAQRGDGLSINPADAIEAIAWAVAVCGVISMMLTLPFTGPSKALSGTQWLGIHLTLLIAGGIGGVMIRVARVSFDDVDSTVSHRFEKGR